jgi:hypothetical protein
VVVVGGFAPEGILDFAIARGRFVVLDIVVFGLFSKVCGRRKEG